MHAEIAAKRFPTVCWLFFWSRWTHKKHTRIIRNGFLNIYTKHKLKRNTTFNTNSTYIQHQQLNTTNVCHDQQLHTHPLPEIFLVVFLANHRKVVSREWIGSVSNVDCAERCIYMIRSNRVPFLTNRDCLYVAIVKRKS